LKTVISSEYNVRMSINMEKEITEPVKLCDERGRLNPAAVGFSRKPLHICNLSRRWLRKKRWNYWNMTTDKFSFSVTVSNVDYLALVFSHFLDYETKELNDLTLPVPFGAGCAMGDRVGDDAVFKSRPLNISLKYGKNSLHIIASAPKFGGRKMSADITVTIPPDHETLNVVVPWNERTFQFTSKQNTLPAEGEVKIGEKTHVLEKEKAFACQDFGRGIWPYRTRWNWSSFSHRQGDDTIGLNLGGIWTDGTGSTENGICLDGRLHKIGDDAVIVYNRRNFMEPWSLQTPQSGAVDLVFAPFYDRISSTNLGLLYSNVHQCFGKFNGVLRVAGREIRVKDAVGWAEEAVSKW